MCVAAPGRVVSLAGDEAVVDISGTHVNVNVSFISPKVGDTVLVHAGCALQILDEDDAREYFHLFEELENAAYDNA